MNSSAAKVRSISKKAGALLERYRLVLLWPLIALVLGASGWSALLTNLRHQKQPYEQAVHREASIIVHAYADHLYRSIQAVDQITLYAKYAWQMSNGRLRLENVDNAGLLPARSGFYVIIIDRNGDILSSTSPAVRSVNASNQLFFITQKNAAEDRLFIGKVKEGIYTREVVSHFSRKLLDENGAFDGVVLVSVVPDYFIQGYDEITLGKYGLLAIIGVDESVRVTRIGDRVFNPDRPALRSAPALDSSHGTAFFDGKKWFADGRNRYVGWQRTEGYGMIVMAGLDEASAFAPYWARRETAIRNAIWASLALAGFTLIGMLMTARLASKQQQLAGLRATYRTATEGAMDAFYIARPVGDPGGHIHDFEVLDCNRRGAEFFRLRRDKLIGRRISDLYKGESHKLAMSTLCDAFRFGEYECEQEQPHDSPVSARWVHVKVVRSGGDLAVTVRDITASKAHMTELERRGNEDALTALPNRNWVKDFLPDAIIRASESKTLLAVLFIDLDGFKTVNDTMGHEAGDELLRNAGRRLKDAVRPHDHVVRIGGDEFVVILEQVAHKGDPAHVAERILAAFQEKFSLPQGTASVGTSIGISVCPDDARDADTLLKNADIAMYSVKTAGKRSYRFFDQNFFDALRVRHEQEAELRHAIEHDHFIIHYQPRVDAVTGIMTSVEALVRWAHPARGLIEPTEFIPLAEETGMILPLGELLIDKVCAQIASWSRHGEKPVPVSVNVSARQFHEARMPEVISQAMARHNINPKLFEIEITESSMMREGPKVSETLAAIRRLGVKLLVDDFGTGYSSLSKLQEMDFDSLKVDKSFTAKLRKTKEGQALFTAIITMAHSLGMRVVAEGVENAEQLDTLRSLHCDEIQGFYVSKPLPASETLPAFRNRAIPSVVS